MYQFFKHNGKWRYKITGGDTANDMDTFALENVLGVMGGPEVIVVRPQPNGDLYHIIVKNGFIDKVENVTFRTECVWTDGGEERCWEEKDGTEVDKFFAKEIVL